MDYMNTNVSLQLNKAAAKIEHSSPDGRNSQAYERRVLHQEKEEEKKELTAEEKLVSLSISLEGLQRMQIKENFEEVVEEASEDEVEYMKKRMEGLSSQAVNGGFTMADRIRFQTEIKFLSDEVIRINNGAISFTKADNAEISKRIDELAKEMNELSRRRRPSSSFAIIANQQKMAAAANKFNIAI